MPSVRGYAFSNTDVNRTFSNLGPWWEHLTSGVCSTSIDHIGEQIAAHLATGIAALATQAPLDDRSDNSVAHRLGVIGVATAGALKGRESSTEAADLLAAVWDGVGLVMHALREERHVSTSGSGTVAALNISTGGVPKHRVDHVEVTVGGIRGDRQGSRQHHGRPWQALCLWSSEVIEAFAARGHPIAPGSAGENITVSGLDWTTIRPGVRARVGDVLVDLSAWTIPCFKNAQWFADGDFRQMSHERGAVSRVYAIVRQPGAVRVGDTVSLIA